MYLFFNKSLKISNRFLFEAFIFFSIFALSMPSLADYDYNIEIIFKDISAKDLHYSSIIWLNDIKAPLSFQQYVQEFENQLLLTFIKWGYTITKNGVIFVYLVDNMTPLLKRYMYILVDDFLVKFGKYVEEFDGNIAPFKAFNHVIDQYFIIEKN